MAQSGLPHFEHHRREMQLTRRRFSLSVLVLCIILSVVVGLQFRGSRAATTVSGTVYNAVTNTPLANITIQLCYNQTVVTNSSGYWSKPFPTSASGDLFCVHYQSGAPSNLSGLVAVNNNPDVGKQSTYEYQVAEKNCYHQAISGCSTLNQQWDRSVDSGYDLKFTVMATPPPTPVPTPAPTPPPAPKTPTPTAAPRPATPKPSAAPAAGQPVAPGAVAAVTDTAPPSVPSGLQILVSGGNAIVSLSWTASTDVSGVKAYELDRSLDQANWVVLSNTITDPNYQDTDAAFGVHYFYRLRAIDNAGNMSDFVTGDATTPDFVSNTGSGSPTTYTSDDKLATVTLPSGALASDAECTVSLDTTTNPSTGALTLVAGPYVLVCKDSSGASLTALQQPVTWTYDLNGKLKGLANPVAANLDASGKVANISGASFDSKTQTIKFTSAQLGTTLVLASKKPGFPINLVIILAALIVMVAGFLVFILRRAQKQNYDDYLRSKYYNL